VKQLDWTAVYCSSINVDATELCRKCTKLQILRCAPCHLIILVPKPHSDEILRHIYCKTGPFLCSIELHAEALSYFKKSEEISAAGEKGEVYWLKAQRLIWIGDSSEAVESYKWAMCLSSNENVIDGPAESEEYERALKFYENALAIRLSLSQKPQSDQIIGHIHYKMGACLYRIGRYAKAIWHFVKSEANLVTSSEIPTKVTFSETLIWICDCYCKQGNYSKSLNFCKEAISSTNIK